MTRGPQSMRSCRTLAAHGSSRTSEACRKTASRSVEAPHRDLLSSKGQGGTGGSPSGRSSSRGGRSLSKQGVYSSFARKWRRRLIRSSLSKVGQKALCTSASPGHPPGKLRQANKLPRGRPCAKGTSDRAPFRACHFLSLLAPQTSHSPSKALA